MNPTKAAALAKLRELLEGHIVGEYDFGMSIAFHTDLTLGRRTTSCT